MLFKTSELDQDKFARILSQIRGLKNEKKITKPEHNILVDKVKRLFGVDKISDEYTLADHFVNKYSDCEITFRLLNDQLRFDDSERQGKELGDSNIVITFKGEEDYIEHKLRVVVYTEQSQLNKKIYYDCVYYVKGALVANIQVKDPAGVRMLVARLIGQKLYND